MFSNTFMKKKWLMLLKQLLEGLKSKQLSLFGGKQMIKTRERLDMGPLSPKDTW